MSMPHAVGSSHERKGMLGTIRNKIVFSVLLLILCIQVISAVLQSFQVHSIYINEFTQRAKNLSHVVFSKLDVMGRTSLFVKADLAGEEKIKELSNNIELYIQIIQFENFESVLSLVDNLVSISFINKQGQLIATSARGEKGFLHRSKKRGDVNEPPNEYRDMAEKRKLDSFQAKDHIHVFVPYVFDGTYFGGIVLSYDITELRQAKFRIFLISGALVITFMLSASLFVYSFIGRVLTRPVRELTRMMANLADGKLNQWYQIESMDEIGEMGKSVNDLVLSLQSTFSDIRSAVASREKEGPQRQTATERSLNLPRLIDGIRRAEFELRLLSRKLIDTIEQERHKLAADLHDDVGQSLTTLQFDLSLIEQSLGENDEEQKMLCREAKEKTKELARIIRATCSRLRPDLLSEMGLASAIRSRVNQLNQQGAEPRIEFATNASEKRLDAQMELALYRVFQEALNNVKKHAHAKQVHVTLSLDPFRVSLDIQDDGVGFEQQDRQVSEDPPARGVGLLIMKERVAALNGELRVESRREQGTRITAILPI
jgi:signal transduction histidine kinase